MKFDDILQEIGEFGWYQKVIVFLLFLPTAFLAMQDFGYIFTSAIPKYRCFVNGCDNDTSSYVETFLNITTPFDYSADEYSQCQLYSPFRNSSNDETCPNYDVDRSQTYNCDSWKYDQSDYESTVVTEWNLVCADSNLVALSQSIYMLGNMVGGLISGVISDKYGRKKMLSSSILVSCAVGISSAFVPYYPLFLTLRFFLGASTQSVYLILFVMSKNYRGFTGMALTTVYSVGEIAFGGIAFAIRDWQILQVVTSAPFAVFLLYYWFIPESPRWMLTNGHMKGARKTLQKIADSNGKVLTDEMLTDFEPDDTKSGSVDYVKVEKLTWVDLFRTSYLRMITINSCLNWFLINIAYFGITMSAPSVGGNQYTNFIIVSSVEIPAYLFGLLAMDKFGRRYPLCLCMIVGGIAGICTAVVPSTSDNSWLTITLATIGKFGAAAAFGIIYLFTAELYPTSIRNNGIAVSSFIGHIGSVIAPYIAALETVNPYLPMVIFGICSLASGLMGLTLPETLGKKLPDTIEDCEDMKVCWCSPGCKSSNQDQN